MESDETIYPTFRAAFDILSEIKTSVSPSILSLCVPIGAFLNSALSQSENNSGGVASESDTLKNDTMKNDTMKNDTTKNDTVKNDTLKNDTLKNDSLKSDTLRTNFAECLIKACHMIIGSENQDSIKIFTEAYKRFVILSFDDVG